jgi:hypothetical protein
MMPASRLIKRASLFRIAGACIILTIMLFIFRYNYNYCIAKKQEYHRIGTGISIAVKRRNSEELYDLYGDTIEYYKKLEYKYHYAAWQPWLTLMPDPPKPRVPRESQ